MMPSFLDRLSFATLISPIPLEDFLSQYWERKPLVIHRNDPTFYGDLLTLRDFDYAVANGASHVKTAEAKSKKAGTAETQSTSGLETLLADMRGGSTLVLDRLHQREPKLGRLCRLLEAEIGHRFQTNCYLTPPHGAGFTPHWDNHDVFILQVEGSKHWKVEKERRRLPGLSEYMGEDEGRFVKPDADSFTLNKGDLIYIPRGVVHAAECSSDPSLHITLGLNIKTWEDLLKAAMRALVLEDEQLNYALPPGFLRGDGEALAKNLLANLRKAAGEKNVRAVVQKFRNDLVTTFPPDVSGQVEDFFQPPQLAMDVVVGPRRGAVYRVVPGDDSVELNFAGRTITFPGFFGEPLKFALNTPSYAIGDIAGELEDEEKIVFVERLMQEGLVVRH